jgi:hypothetical protein
MALDKIYLGCFTLAMDPNTIIERAGGTCAMAILCEVSKQAVSQWRNDGIPRARLMYLKAVRPDLFEPEPNGQATETNSGQK